MYILLTTGRMLSNSGWNTGVVYTSCQKWPQALMCAVFYPDSHFGTLVSCSAHVSEHNAKLCAGWRCLIGWLACTKSGIESRSASRQCRRCAYLHEMPHMARPRAQSILRLADARLGLAKRLGDCTLHTHRRLKQARLSTRNRQTTHHSICSSYAVVCVR